MQAVPRSRNLSKGGYIPLTMRDMPGAYRDPALAGTVEATSPL